MTSSRLASMGIVLLAGALYGVLNTLTIGLSLPGSDVDVGIRPQVVIPMLGGFLMGPAHGFVIGCGGNFLGDWLNGLGLEFWPFSLGNGLMGMMPGLVHFWGEPRVNNVSRFAVLLVLIVAGTTLGMGSGVLVYQFFVQDSLQILTWTFFHPMIVANVICAFILFPPLLFFFKKISSTFDINLGVILMYLLMCVVAALVFFLNLISSQTIKRELAGALPDNVLRTYMETAASDGFRYGGSIGIVAILISVGLTFALIQYLARPVRTLIDAAGQLKEGRLDRINLEALMKKNDEFGRLAQVFSDAVEQVRSREKSMQEAIKELRLEIDRDQEARQVKEITETDYFQSLRHRTLELRARKEKLRNEKNRH
jgi:uncharacterized membrane protein/HAMP domain-containing protein